MRIHLIFLLTITIFTLAFLAIGSISVQLEERYVIKVGAQDNLLRLSDNLAKQGIIEYPSMLLFYARLLDRTQIKKGIYYLSAEDSYSDLVYRLHFGEQPVLDITFIGGSTTEDILSSLNNHNEIIHTLTGKNYQQIQEQLGIVGSIEGAFLPETYNYHPGALDVEILRRSHRDLQQFLQDQWQQRDPIINGVITSPYKALILASIIEKEAGNRQEMSKISGVFYRRLKKGMRLQTDPTVIYGVGKNFKGDLTYAMLKQDTPYNTYRRHGLPPTPIALSSRHAIYAALHPEQGDEVYFVATGKGNHIFSTSLFEHQQAVKKYQKKNR